MPVLHWLDRNKTLATTPKVPCRILRADDGLSFGKKDSGNMLIQGDNLHALKALLPYFRGAVKCVFIDPPYNTKSAFEHYSDSLEHSKWLDMMVPRLELLRELLAEDGSIWVTIDDHEAHYLKVVMDEIFGRGNFVANAIWQKKYAPQNDAKWLSDDHDHVLCYARHKETWRPYSLPRTEASNALYKNPDNDPRGSWMSDNLSVKTYSAATDYSIISPMGKITNPPPGRCWIYSKEKMQELMTDNRIWFGAKGTAGPRLKKFLSEVKDGMVCRTIWLRDQTSDNQEARREVRVFNMEDIFQTPKPEKLLQ